MLSELHLVDTGPGPRLDLELGARLNVLTGDNGLGKSFVLDVIWWTLTGAWGSYPAGPFRPPGQTFSAKGSHPSIAWRYRSTGAHHLSTYHHPSQRWADAEIDTAPAGPIVYARADGSILVCDPLREGPGGQHTPRGGFTVWEFDERSLWRGAQTDDGEVICRGLLEDWVTWRLMHAADQDSPYPRLEEVLAVLSPHEGERLRLGEPIRVYRNMAQWQRQILPALLRAVQSFWGEEIAVQVVVTTHAPLVLASLEPSFDPAIDALFRFEVQDGRAVIERQVWAKEGDVVN